MEYPTTRAEAKAQTLTMLSQIETAMTKVCAEQSKENPPVLEMLTWVDKQPPNKELCGTAACVIGFTILDLCGKVEVKDGEFFDLSNAASTFARRLRDRAQIVGASAEPLMQSIYLAVYKMRRTCLESIGIGTSMPIDLLREAIDHPHVNTSSNPEYALSYVQLVKRIIEQTPIEEEQDND